ncbi:MAG TPA: metal ABC transporter ATP-binding protein [Acidobacteriaceae bacterium]|nr:metal ABC transporter ATP-binding protein [Terriglobia bacterium]HVC90891.1 metal ABC transporter ATP-binding protein [Acidobacteriaceae bacterium]
MTTGSILSVRGLNIQFGSRSVIQNLSFDVDTGDNVAIIGPNGAGKTVLLKALLGLLPYEGEIRWSPGARLGYVPQKVAADRQMPIRVHDLLAAKARVLKLHSRSIETVAAAVDLTPEVLTASIGTISSGQFQKALIAFALLGEPNVLLFDEPTASLDELAEEKIYDLVERLQQEKHLTVVLVSHDLSIVYRAANKVLCLSKDMVCFGPPREVLTPAALEAMYSAPSKYYLHRRGLEPMQSDKVAEHD